MEENKKKIHVLVCPSDGYGVGWLDTVTRDKIKKRLCNKNGIKLLYFTELKKYNKFMGEKLIKTKDKLLENIEKNGRK